MILQLVAATAKCRHRDWAATTGSEICCFIDSIYPSIHRSICLYLSVSIYLSLSSASLSHLRMCLHTVCISLSTWFSLFHVAEHQCRMRQACKQRSAAAAIAAIRSLKKSYGEVHQLMRADTPLKNPYDRDSGSPVYGKTVVEIHSLGHNYASCHFV